MEKMNCNICDHCRIVIPMEASVRISYRRFDFCSWNCCDAYFNGEDYNETENKDKDSEG